MDDEKLPQLPVSLLWMRILNLGKLNLLWLVCCLPVVTIGPATSAMHYVIGLYLHDASDEVVRPFFKAFRRDFRQGLLLGLLQLGLTALALFNGLFLLANYGAHPIWLPLLLLVLFLAALLVYGFPLLCRYTLGFGELLKNSVLFFWQNFGSSLLALAIYFSPVLLVFLFPRFLTEILFFLILIGPALLVYLVNGIVNPLLDREQRRQESQQLCP